MSSATDQELADSLIAWADAFPIETSTYQQYWDALKGENAEFFRRFDADRESVTLGQAYTDAMARADDDGPPNRRTAGERPPARPAYKDAPGAPADIPGDLLPQPAPDT
mgnify:CR=1 FL=1